MPRPKYHSWLCEPFLVAGYHYVEVSRDFSDLLEKIEWCRAHDEECRQIAENGKEFMKQFQDGEKEAMLEHLVVTFCEQNVHVPEEGPIVTKYPDPSSWSKLHYTFKAMLQNNGATHVGTVKPDVLSEVTCSPDFEEYTFRNSDFSKQFIQHLLINASGTVAGVLRDMHAHNVNIRNCMSIV